MSTTAKMKIKPIPCGLFENAGLHCTLSEITAELISELDTDVISKIANTVISMDLKQITKSHQLQNGGKFDLTISHIEYNGVPCYSVAASLPVDSHTFVQLSALVSTHLDTMFESRTVTFDQAQQCCRYVWGVNIQTGIPPHTGLAGSTADKLSSPLIVLEMHAMTPQQDNPEVDTPYLDTGDIVNNGKADITNPLNHVGHLSKQNDSHSEKDDNPSDLSPLITQNPTISTSHLKTETNVREPHYIILETKENLVEGNHRDLSTHTYTINYDDCPGILFSGSELIFLFIVALHAQSTVVPELFSSNVYEAKEIVPLELECIPDRAYIVEGQGRHLVGVRVQNHTKTTFASLLGHEAQWYFEAMDIDESPGMELVNVIRVGGMSDLVATNPKTVCTTPSLELMSAHRESVSQEKERMLIYLQGRADVTTLLVDFMRTLLLKKPADVYEFAREFFGNSVFSLN